jgi:hypothetical protein
MPKGTWVIQRDGLVVLKKTREILKVVAITCITDEASCVFKANKLKLTGEKAQKRNPGVYPHIEASVTLSVWEHKTAVYCQNKSGNQISGKPSEFREPTKVELMKYHGTFRKTTPSGSRLGSLATRLGESVRIQEGK